MARRKKILTIWLSVVITSIIFQILLGGYVRLTDSGLSMYDWHVVKGIIPPISDSEWQETFESYKQTPEYLKINVGMSLEEYKQIYVREFNHRVLGRITGLIFVIPLIIFLFAGWLKWRTSKIYILSSFLYAGQGILGWYMVKSGLVDHPHVSHLRLAAHFVLALFIFALLYWKLLDLIYGDKEITRIAFLNRPLRILSVFTILFAIQVTYGAFIAGLDAGFVSDTFPLMFGFLIPPNLFVDQWPWMLNFFENSVMVHFIHRWFAFIIFGFALYSWIKIKEQMRSVFILPLAVSVQILLGLMVIWFHVPLYLALLHQFVAITILGATIGLAHKSLDIS